MKGFLIYTEWIDQFSLLSDMEAGMLIKALLTYSSTGQVPDGLSGATMMAFSFMKSQIDRDSEKYAETCERNRANGRRGGRPRKPGGFPENPPDIQETERFSKKPKKANENKKKNENKKEKDISPPIVPHGDGSHDQGESLTVEMADGSTRKRVAHHSKTLDRAKFDRFWAVYPRHVGKSVAEKSFEKLAPDDDLMNIIISALECQKKCSQWQDERYIPHASTWLNQRRWEDEIGGRSHDGGTISGAGGQRPVIPGERVF